VKRIAFRRRVGAVAVVILLFLFLVRPGAERLKARITNAISRSVQRPADIGSVHIRFLPQPGFDLDNVVVYEDPSFGAEPMLRAPEVTAVVRLTSLLRGKLDISRLELTEPSLNLVRREDGRWNWNMLLERTARSPLAPTAKAKSETRPGFPYIEASSGRINLKIGAEKKSYALLNADFAVWQESENEWGIRLKAEPVRTDMNLSDAGLVRLSGIWQRAGSLRETPLQFNLEWRHAPLGQFTKLFYGNDKGWRGDVQVEAAFSGTPSTLHITTDASVQDFHRYDILVSEGLRLATHCEANYSTVDDIMREIFCLAPVGDGMITLKGNSGSPGSRNADLSLDLENVPANAVAQLARRAKKDLPPDLVAAGVVQGNFKVSENGNEAGANFEGHGEFTNLRLESAINQAQIAPPNIPFALTSASSALSARGAKHARLSRRARFAASTFPQELRLEFGPFPVALGRPPAAQIYGWMSLSDYEIAIKGNSEISRVLRLASLLGVQAIKANVDGAAQLDLQIGGSWSAAPSGAQGFAPPAVNGTAQLHGVRLIVAGIHAPIEILSAKLRLSGDKARMDDMNAETGGSHWNGWIEQPRGCGSPGACVANFSLSAGDLGLGDVREWLSSHRDERHWYQVLSPQQAGIPPILQSLRAVGKLNVSRLRFRDAIATQVSASIEMERGRVNVTDLSANLLGGNHRGDWQIDFTAPTPVYGGTGTLTGVSLGQLAGGTHDPWITGTVAGTYKLKASGASTPVFWQSLKGGIGFNLREGAFPHISLTPDDSPLQIARWQGKGELHDGKLEIDNSQLDSSRGIYELSGTATFAQALDFKLTTERAAKSTGSSLTVYNITGTLAEPQVTLTPGTETQARLKP
jgi:hypothetical protein